MKRKTKLNCWLGVGILLALGPLWGIIGSVLGMILSFGAVTQSQMPAETFAGNIGFALLTTVVGFILCPIGVALMVVSAVKLSKETQSVAETSPSVSASR